MESSFLNFIRSGQIGLLKTGMKRAEVRSIMGDPQRWLGKPPHINGPICDFPEESELWFYYGDAVKIGFDGLEETSVSNSLTLWTENINNKLDIFLNWPIGPKSTMGQLRECMAKTNIPWYESPDDKKGDSYSLLFNDNCYAICFTCKDGDVIPPMDREIVMIEFIADRKLLPRFIRHLLPPELQRPCPPPQSCSVLKPKEEQIQAFLQGDFGDWARQQLDDPKDIDNKKFSDFFNVTEEEIWQYVQKNGGGTILSDEAFCLRPGSDPKVVEKLKKKELHTIFKMVKMYFDDRYYQVHQELDLPDQSESK